MKIQVRHFVFAFLLYLVRLMLCRKGNKLLAFGLCHFRISSVIFYLLYPNILDNTLFP